MSVSPAGKTFALFANPANKKIINELEANGAHVILFPTVETEEITPDSQAEKLLKNLSDFDWLIFSNVFAVDHFLQALEKLEVDLFELDALQVCAFGETVADRLRFSQVHSDVISNSVDSDEVFKALKDYEPDFETSRFLIPKEEKSNLEIVSLLSKSGADITELSFYRARINELARLPKLEALLKGGAIDEFVFGLPSDAAHLAILFRTEKLPTLLSDIIITATTPSTYQSLREYGFTRITTR